jgi:hypothetical protein
VVGWWEKETAALGAAELLSSSALAQALRGEASSFARRSKIAARLLLVTADIDAVIMITACIQ